MDSYRDLLGRAAAWLEARGYKPVAKLVIGEPAPAIGAVAKELNADLVVVGHHQKGALSRWWSGSTDSYLSDHLGCTLLIARNPLTEEAFDAAQAAMVQPAASGPG
jgi:nucleotide-binding universal stress UspA family protein